MKEIIKIVIVLVLGIVVGYFLANHQTRLGGCISSNATTTVEVFGDGGIYYTMSCFPILK